MLIILALKVGHSNASWPSRLRHQNPNWPNTFYHSFLQFGIAMLTNPKFNGQKQMHINRSASTLKWSPNDVIMWFICFECYSEFLFLSDNSKHKISVLVLIINKTTLQTISSGFFSQSLSNQLPSIIGFEVNAYERRIALSPLRESLYQTHMSGRVWMNVHTSLKTFYKYSESNNRKHAKTHLITHTSIK